MTEPSPPLVPLVQVGDVLAGKYRVERILGQGAMGMVVAAMHTELQERRAIKFMLPAALGEADGVERFLREARACARLKSKHVAAVYDVGRLETGAPYIVMEYLEGSDLKDLLHNRKVLPVHEAVGYMLQACEAIGEAHQAGIVHRDLKPANMFMASGVGGVPCLKILDFGIAKLAPVQGLGQEQQEMTSTGTIMGSPLYMSPEQMRSSRHADARSDIWSLGVILYRMVTGAMPFQAQTAPELFAIVLMQAPPPPRAVNAALPPALEAIIMRCLEKDPTQRFQSIPELVEALKPFTVPGAGLGKDATDATTHLWRPPAASMPEGWYRGTNGGAGVPAMVMPPLSSSGVQAQTATPPGTVATLASATPTLHEPGSTSRSNGTWSQTGVGQAPPTSNTRIIALGLAAGGALFFAGVMVVVLLMRGNASSNAGPTAPPTAEQAAQTATAPAPSVQTPAPSATPAESAAASASAGAAPPEGPEKAGTPGKTPGGTAAKSPGTAKTAPATPTAATATATTPSGEDLFGNRRK